MLPLVIIVCMSDFIAAAEPAAVTSDLTFENVHVFVPNVVPNFNCNFFVVVDMIKPPIMTA